MGTLLVRIGLSIIALSLGAIIWALVASNTANAGTGPSGFAAAAKAGINAQLIKAYGSLSNSPWKVECSEKPNYVALTDSVVCHITEK